jgi:GPH family glycoside/pentoside/hexuronide:cation symporter
LDPTRHSGRMPHSRLLAYGGPMLGLAYLLFFLQFYFLKYATDVLLLSPAVVGALFAAAKLWDALAGPLVGSVSDRARSRFGRRRPFMVAALPLLAGGFAMLWMAPESLGDARLVAWIAAALLVFYTAFDLYGLTHQALGAELSRDSHERTRLFAARQMSFTVGMLLAFAGIQVAMNSEAPRRVAAELAVPAALASALLLGIPPLVLREPAPEGRSGGRGLLSAFRDVLSMRPARLLLFVQLVESTGIGAVGTMAPYVSEYIVQRPDVVAALPAAYVLAAILSIPVWVRASRRFGKRATWLGAMVLASLSFGGMWMVGPGDLVLVMGLLVVAGCAMGCGGVLAPALLADVIDLDELRTGERKEGVYSAAMTLVLKLGTSVATAASGVVLTAAGFEPNVAQSPTSLFGIRILFAGMPCVGFALGALAFRRFTLEDAGSSVAAAPVHTG